MATDKGRLCRDILREHFGEQVEKIAALLITKGRLSLTQICRLEHLSQTQVLKSLFVLMQHNIVLQAEQEEGNRLVTYYSIDMMEVLLRNRIPLYMDVVESKYKEAGAEIIKNLSMYGKLTVESFISEYAKAELSDGEERIPDQDLRSTFQNLINDAYIVRIEPTDTVSIVDKRLAYIQDQVFNAQGVTQQQKKKIMNEAEAMKSFSSDYSTGRKRKASEVEETITSKRRRSQFSSNQDMYRINHDRFTIDLRNQLLHQTTCKKIDNHAGVMMKYVLKLCTKNIYSGYGNMTAENMASILASTITFSVEELSYEFRNYEFPKPPNTTLTLQRRNQLIKAYLDTMSTTAFSDDMNPTHAESAYSTTASKTLRPSLCEPLLPYLKRVDEFQGDGKYQVVFDKAVEYHRQKLIEKMVLAKFGSTGLSVWRMLLLLGKMEERSITKRCMSSSNDVRKSLFEMFNDGFVQIMDIPKSKDYTRNYNLWYVDFQTVVTNVTNRLYKSLCNLYEVLMKEKADKVLLIEKFEREDVQQNLDMLPEHEKAILLKFWADKELLEGEIVRIEREIMMFRDV